MPASPGSWAAGWAVGTYVTSTEMAKGVGSIYDTTLGVSAASVDITSIVSAYAHLIIRVYARSDAAVTSQDLKLRLNNDTGANYDVIEFTCGGGTGSSANSFSGETSFDLAAYVNGASSPANLFSTTVYEIENYANTSNNKTVYCRSGRKIGTGATDIAQAFAHCFWRSNAAINRLTVFPASGNLVAGTRVTVYGMGA